MKYIIVFAFMILSYSGISQYADGREQYFMVGIGASAGFISRDYNDGLFDYRNRRANFSPTLLNLRYGLPFSSRSAFLANVQLSYFTEQNDDIIDTFFNSHLDLGISYLLDNENLYLLIKTGFASLNRSVGINISPGIGYKIGQKINLELETSVSRYGRYNFTNFRMTDLRISLHYTFGS